ncbi:MAG: hypothetical protein HY820_05005 [Acidobacteria bacterium]|nr:hypothetical protein [Acidobacteriota bacterium]
MSAKWWLTPMLFFAGATLPAATIISAVDGPPPNSLQLNDPGSTVTGAAVVSWTQSVSYTNVSISAYLFANVPALAGQPEQYKAYLTNIAGPGTTAANNIASPVTGAGIPFVAPAPGSPTLLFSGLTLGPGNYLLTIQALNTSDGGLLWESKAGLVPTVGAGVAYGALSLAMSDGSIGQLDAGFAPASSFAQLSPNGTVMFEVSGDLVAPEPTNLLLCGAGFLALGLLRRYRP